MKRVAILSDSHGLLRPEVRKELEAADCLIHAGDLDTPDILRTLEEYGESYIVRGNNDVYWSNDLPRTLQMEIEGVRFLVVHNKMDLWSVPPDIDVVIYGHTHRYDQDQMGKVLWLNPGSCGWPRFRSELSMIRMEIHQGKYQIHRIDLKG